MPSPDWTWVTSYDEFVKTVTEARARNEIITKVSLDHDLADVHYQDYDILTDEQKAEYNKEKTGYDVVKWFVENNFWPLQIIIHSHNPDGRKRMWELCNDHKKHAVVIPYTGLEI